MQAFSFALIAPDRCYTSASPRQAMQTAPARRFVLAGVGMYTDGSVWERVYAQKFDQRLITEGQLATLAARTLNNLNTGHYDKRYVSGIMQVERRDLTLYEASAFMDIHTALARGMVLYTTVKIGMKPSGDIHKKANGDKLAKLRDMRFYSVGEDGARRDEALKLNAHFFGGSQSDFDGEVEWDGNLEFGIRGKPPVVLPKGRFPLEVGTIPPQRAIAHFARWRCLARWPYGLDELWLFLVADDKAWPDVGLPRRAEEPKIVHIDWTPKVYQQLSLFDGAA